MNYRYILILSMALLSANLHSMDITSVRAQGGSEQKEASETAALLNSAAVDKKRERPQDANPANEPITKKQNEPFSQRKLNARFYHAAGNCDFGAMKSLLSAQAYVNVQDPYGHTALHRAAAQGHLECVKLLLANRADSLVCGKMGETPLHAAAVNRHDECITVLKWEQFLVRCRHDLSWKGEHGETKLHTAAAGGQLDLIKGLLAVGALIDASDSSGMTALHYAVTAGKVESVEALVQDPKVSIDATDKDGRTALHIASEKGYHNIVQALLSAGASVALTTNDGTTALHFAVRNGCTETVKMLLAHKEVASFIETRAFFIEKGTSYWTAKSFGTALHAAVCQGYHEIIQLLFSAGASVVARSGEEGASRGYTALHFAVKKGCTEMVKMLLGHKDIASFRDRRSDDGDMALHLAAAMDHDDIIQLLLAAGADVDSVTTEGSTALHRAARCGSVGSIKVLLTHNANSDAQDNKQNTPLHHAASGLWPAAVQILLEAGADADAENREAKKPRDLVGNDSMLAVFDEYERKKIKVQQRVFDDSKIAIALKNGTVTIGARQRGISGTLNNLSLDASMQVGAIMEVSIPSISLDTWTQIFNLVPLDGDMSSLELLCSSSSALYPESLKAQCKKEIREALAHLALDALADILRAANYLHIDPLVEIMVDLYASKIYAIHTKNTSKTLVTLLWQEYGKPKKSNELGEK